MKDKVKGTILAVAGGIGTVWALINITPWVPWAVAFVFCAVIFADGIATIATEIQADKELKAAKKKYEVPLFLDLDKED